MFLQGYTLNVVGERIVPDMRVQLYRHLHTLSLSFFASRCVGEIVSRISSHVTQVRSILTYTTPYDNHHATTGSPHRRQCRPVPLRVASRAASHPR
jgi:ABC-type multidrug transport system fused ATPase/permease subunit